MTTTLLTTGLVCLIAAIVGGGLTAFGIKIPLLTSLWRQLLLGFLGVCLLVAAYSSPTTDGPVEPQCEDAPQLLLNEVCAEGKECDGQKDFVEIYNPSDTIVNLSCYALVDIKAHRKPLTGELPAREIRAWTDDDLGFGLSREEDKISLIRIRPGGGELVDDTRTIDDSSTYQQRVPNGGAQWETMTHDEVASDGNVGSLNGANRRER